MFWLGLEAQSLLSRDTVCKPALSGHHPPPCISTPFSPLEANERLRLVGTCSGIFTIERTGDHREDLLKALRFKTLKYSLFHAALHEVTLGFGGKHHREAVREIGALTLETNTIPPSWAFMVALGGRLLHLQMVKLQAQSQTSKGICPVPLPRAEFGCPVVHQSPCPLTPGMLSMNISNLDRQKEASTGFLASLSVAVTRRQEGRSPRHCATNLVGGMGAPLELRRAVPGPSLVGQSLDPILIQYRNVV